MSQQRIFEVKPPSGFSKFWSKLGLTANAKDQQEVLNVFNQQWRFFEKWVNQSQLKYQGSGPVGDSQQLTGDKIVKRWPELKKILQEIGISDLSAQLSQDQASELIYTLSIKIVTNDIDDEDEDEAPEPPTPPAPVIKLNLDTIADLKPAQAAQILRALNQPRAKAVKLADSDLDALFNSMRKLQITKPRVYQKLFNALYTVTGTTPPPPPVPESIETDLKEKYQKFLKET
jgi:hypothetical protein